jgi:hypothetical protein
MRLPLTAACPRDGAPQLATALAAKLRDPDPGVRAEFAERLVRACDRYNRPLEQIIGKALEQPWRPPLQPPVPPKTPMGQMNWLSWCRFILHHDLTEWERRFIANVMRKAYPSAGQKAKLREILLKVHAAGCGKWGLAN